MLQTAQENIHSVHDRARNYIDKSKRDITFHEGDMVYLKVLMELETLKTRKCQNLSLRYYEPFKSLRTLGM